MKAGDLVRYMSRTLLVIACPDDDPDWAECIELGEEIIGRYRRSVLKPTPETVRREIEDMSPSYN